MKWTGKKVSVIGLGQSNQALIHYLARKGVRVIARDQKDEMGLGAAYERLSALGVEFHLGESYLEGLEASDGIFVTPGMRKDLPQLLRAKEAGVPISTEINLFFELCRAPIVGVTGSSGKTTTTSLIGAILEAAGHKTYVGGNIGNPLINSVDDISPRSAVVLELSSFQLELLERSPNVAVITNISPNHLDFHGTMDAYIHAKSRIFAFQKGQDVLIVNQDDTQVNPMAHNVSSHVLRFSRRGEVRDGAFIDDGRIVLSRHSRGGRSLVDVCSTREIRLLGDHNLENVLAACTVGHLLGATAGTMREVITSFTGVVHRLELVREAGGVRYYNDSIATSPARAAAGLKAFDRPVHLIAGGYDKLIPFDELAEAACHKAKAVYLIGETADAIEKAIAKAADGKKTAPLVMKFRTLDEAVAAAKARAMSGDVVLLSPGCASYDMFPNFEARGDRFRKLVHSLTEAMVPNAHEITKES